MSPSWFSSIGSPSLERSFIAQLPSTDPVSEPPSSPSLWMYSTIGLTVALVGLLIYGKRTLDLAKREVNRERFKSKDLKNKLKLALHTIKKMETNPDLVHSRSFNLDYLRMRMDEEVFHYVIVNQIKMKISRVIGEALRPNTAKTAVGITGSGRQIDENFDVTYEVETQEGKWNKGVLFRLQIKITKLPTQTSTATVNEIIDCVERFLSADSENDNWQPAIHGQLVLISWDQKAKPTPLLVLEQSEEGVNISFRSTPLKVSAPIAADSE
jgi:hypothetical protein